MKRQQHIAWLVCAAVLALEPTALGWSFGIGVHMTVNGHEFHRVAVESDGCKLNVALRFNAPASGYDAKAKVRNYHRFRARLLFKNGKAITTDVYANDRPGKRVIRLSHDTEYEACWAKEKVELKDVDVIGCRAKRCRVGEFARVTPEFSN